MQSLIECLNCQENCYVAFGCHYDHDGFWCAVGNANDFGDINLPDYDGCGHGDTLEDALHGAILIHYDYKEISA